MPDDEKKVVRVEHLEVAPDDCDLCESSLQDPYRLVFKDGSSAWTCEDCGSKLEEWGLIPKVSKKSAVIVTEGEE